MTGLNGEQVQSAFDQAVEGRSSNPQQSLTLFRQIIHECAANGDETVQKLQEQAIDHVGELLAEAGEAQSLIDALSSYRQFFTQIPKARTAKIVRTYIDFVGRVPNTTQVQINLCKEWIEWCRQEKRTFLRQRVETRLAALLFETGEFQPALGIVNNLLREVKRLDDKPQLVEIHLLESRIHHSLRNLPKSKAGLTSARTAANAIYCPPALQGEIDRQAGILHAEERDYKTGYSYFFEAFETYTNMDERQSHNAVQCLKYMLLCKIMTNNADEVTAILNSKNGLKFAAHHEIEAIRAVANSHKERKLKEFEAHLRTYKAELADDAVVSSHLKELYGNLLEQNLVRIIEPFSRVEIGHVAKLIDLPLKEVEQKLSQMILDKKFHGILDQGEGCLIVYDDPNVDDTYTKTLDTVKNMSNVVDSLYNKAKKLE